MSQSMVSGRQIKAARALLGWTRQDLASAAGVTAPTVKVVETDADNLDALAPTRDRLREALEAVGIEFTNGGALGVRLLPRDDGLPVDALNASNDD